jgi:A/G-specific adenine glycosylase
MKGQAPGFAARVVRWQTSHGRQGLPWQGTHDPYRVWLSEIMLQQTQVVTVLDYYPRFLEKFPTVATLAAARQDDVLALWSGLGYYSRARNLHRCAQVVVEQYAGNFPGTAEQLQTLPGIGRSTAAAIAAFCFAERVAILDANVQRVLTRLLGFAADLAQAAAQRQLWAEATKMLPVHDLNTAMPRYTQGLMDLGATLCTPKRPKCADCPVQSLCEACATGQQEAFPVKTRTLKRSSATLWLLWAQRADGAVWLSQRPTPGVWAGLYCLPAFATDAALLDSLPARARGCVQFEPTFTHVLTHRDLFLHPVKVMLPDSTSPAGEGAWHALEQALRLGLPAPVRKLLAATGA